jgi:hypothetical protein
VWAQHGEAGTAWFHRLGRTRPPRAPITALQPPRPFFFSHTNPLQA